jgi:hypothetical protein
MIHDLGKGRPQRDSTVYIQYGHEAEIPEPPEQKTQTFRAVDAVRQVCTVFHYASRRALNASTTKYS